MSSITLYAGENFAGKGDVVTNNRSSYQPGSPVQSISVQGDAIWIVYSQPNYKGVNIAVYKQGEYKSNLKIQNIRSLQILPGTLENHSIQVFEENNWKIPAPTIEKASNPSVSFPIKSHKVDNGVWILHDVTGFAGNSAVSIAQNTVANETNIGLGEVVKSLKAYVTYETPN
ncbi:gamma-crystallin D-like [Engystomops pustulosus]|uniref:gamma-crystallin D-like n=1 Tax=Engystomops pustulosus TaxID=76066 RepID=UPI003AFAD454